ncbi:MAG: MBL fold metallo-hydrolase [Deltaproteobacteria bacterium]|nr:MBL fold metallo-hydrolase [Deltaproteobacteria bacterium]
MSDTRKGASQHTKHVNCNHANTLPFDDEQSFVDASRGFIATWDHVVIRSEVPGDVDPDNPNEQRVVWSLEPYEQQTVDAPTPDTVNPSLWRQARLNSLNGLFEIAEGFYQVRAFDMSNMTIIEGDGGLIIIDPMISCECAAAGLRLYRENRPQNADTPVVAVIYTHSHVDHFGGVGGVVTEQQIADGVQIIAPEGFLEHAVSENVYAGVAMARRAMYMYGALLPADDKGQVDCGLGKTSSMGRVSVFSPTLDITHTGQTVELAGIEIVFHMTPGGEAPAEVDFYFPERKIFCAAENVTQNMHNLQTLRGAPVRDPLAWSNYLNEALEMFGDAEIMFASHHWPTWGNANIRDFLSKQRDMYRYFNDQTLRMLNKGYTGIEVAEVFEMSPGLTQEWGCRGYYGTISHNVKAVYDRYMGWFDGNPTHLHALSPADSAAKYVELMGDAEGVIAAANLASEEGDYRWAAQLLGHLVYAEPDNTTAKNLQADAFEQLGYQAESAPWRSFYLMGAKELREGIVSSSVEASSRDMVEAISTAMVFDALAASLIGPKAAKTSIVMKWVIKDAVTTPWLVRVSNGALSYNVADGSFGEETPQVTITLTRTQLTDLIVGELSLDDLSEAVEGEARKLIEFFRLMDDSDPAFPIVTPRADATADWAGEGPGADISDSAVLKRRRRMLLTSVLRGC